MRKWPFWTALLALIAVAGFGVRPLVAGKAGEGTLELTVVDQQSHKPIACRIHLVNAAGVPRKALKAPFWQDHFVCPGQVSLKVPRGNYTFVIERGPEYADATGYFTINDFAEDRKTADLKRAVDMSSEGWWSGDLRVRRPARNVELLMQAEDLHLAVAIPPTQDEPDAVQTFKPGLLRFDDKRYCQLLAPQDKASHGRLVIEVPREAFDDAESADTGEAKNDSPHRAWYDVDDPAAPELPVWLALGQVDSFSLLSGQLVRGKSDTGKKPTRKRGDDGHASAELAQQVYFHMLNCGLRVPPSASSNSGVAANPVGYNRMYAWVDQSDISYDRWWRAVRMGRVTVTNGPLVRPLANGRLPGHDFRLLEGQLELDVAMNLTTRDPITYLELIKNGRCAQSIRLSDWAKTGHFPVVNFKEPGWLLVRVVTDVGHTYRATLSAPWYIDGPSGPRISRKSVTYFLDRLHALEAHPTGNAAAPSDETALTPVQLETANRFWTELLGKANAD